jgi:hypothetical protein
MAEMCVMDRSGDTKTIFDPNNEAEVAAAEATFKALKKKGYMAYRVTGEGGKGEAMHAFDARAGKIILSPPVVGG